MCVVHSELVSESVFAFYATLILENERGDSLTKY